MLFKCCAALIIVQAVQYGTVQSLGGRAQELLRGAVPGSGATLKLSLPGSSVPQEVQISPQTFEAAPDRPCSGSRETGPVPLNALLRAGKSAGIKTGRHPGRNPKTAIQRSEGCSGAGMKSNS